MKLFLTTEMGECHRRRSVVYSKSEISVLTAVLRVKIMMIHKSCSNALSCINKGV